MSILSDVGKIKRILHLPCTPTPQIWVESAGEAALSVIYSTLRPVWKQDVKLLTGKSWLKHLRQTIAQADEAPGVFAGEALEFMFEGFELLDAAVWWFFVASVTAEFLVDWSTLAMQNAGCTISQKHNTYSGIAPFDTLVTKNVWTSGPIWNQTSPTVGGSLTSDFSIPAGRSASYSAALSVTGLLSSTPLPVATRWVDGEGNILAASQTTAEGAAAGANALQFGTYRAPDNVSGSLNFQWMRIDGTGEPLIVTQDGRINVAIGNASDWK